MPSHGACRARARRHPGADPMRAHVPWKRDISLETADPSPSGCPAPRGRWHCGMKGLLGLAGGFGEAGGAVAPS